MRVSKNVKLSTKHHQTVLVFMFQSKHLRKLTETHPQNKTAATRHSAIFAGYGPEKIPKDTLLQDMGKRKFQKTHYYKIWERGNSKRHTITRYGKEVIPKDTLLQDTGKRKFQKTHYYKIWERENSKRHTITRYGKEEIPKDTLLQDSGKR
ncbi:hypothetical protein BgiMline_022620 [Biomphalaria glabrata]